MACDECKPRVVETLEELMSLPDGTYAEDRDGIYCGIRSGEWCHEPGSEMSGCWKHMRLPVKVLYQPKQD